MRNIIILAVLVSGQLSAKQEIEEPKQYTSKDLFEMIEDGRYPETTQIISKSRGMSFDDCKSLIVFLTGNKVEHPTRTIEDSYARFITKVWKSDSHITMSCSRLNGQMTVRSSKYKSEVTEDSI